MPTEHQHARYSFPAYAQGVRTLEVHGTPQQKLEYLFYGYALTCEGQINRDELVELMQAHCKRQPEPDEEEDVTAKLDKVPTSLRGGAFFYLLDDLANMACCDVLRRHFPPRFTCG